MAEERRREEYASLTVAQLKEQLKGRGLPFSGPKGSLIGRLLADDVAAEAKTEPETVELAAAEVGDAAEAAEEAERKLGEAEPKAAPKTCRGCKDELLEGWEYPYCKKCHEGWQRQKRVETRQAAEKALTQVHGILSGIIERNTPSAGGVPWYNFTEAIDLFEKAKAKYAAGDYRNLVGDLYQGVLGKANEITAVGDQAYIDRLIDNEELEETPELQRLRTDADGFLAEKKFREAAGKAQEAKQLAGRLRREQGEAKKRSLLESLSFDLPAMKGRYQGAKKGSERDGSNPRKPRHDPHVRDRRRTQDFLAEVEKEYGEGSVAAQLAARELGREGR